MAIVFGWSANAQAAGLATTLTTSKGANTITSGDLLLLFVSTTDPTGTAIDPGVLSTPAGWTLVDQKVTGKNSDCRAAVYYKIAGGSETGAYTVNWTTNSAWSWALLDYSGTASTPDASLVTTVTTVTASVDAPSISPAGAADTLICFWTGPDSNVTVFPSGLTSRSNLTNSNALVNQPGISVGDNTLSASGATGAQTATWGATRDSYVVSSIAFAAAGGDVLQAQIWM